MSLMRTLSVWTLRGLIAWGAFELGASLYDAAATRAETFNQLAGQSEAMTRLSARAQHAETDAAEAERQLSARMRLSWPPVREGREAADGLRQALVALGAQGATADANLASVGTHMQRVSFTARWREPPETSPAVLHGLAARFPDLTLVMLRMTRTDGFITTDAQFEAFAPSSAGPRP